MAAHDLHMNIKQYSSHDNELIALAKKDGALCCSIKSPYSVV